MSDGNRIFASVTYKGGVKYEGNINLMPVGGGGQVGGTKVEDLKKQIIDITQQIDINNQKLNTSSSPTQKTNLTKMIDALNTQLTNTNTELNKLLQELY